MSPNQAWNNNNTQVSNHLNAVVHNEAVYKSVTIKIGDHVRILEDKDTQFSKGKYKFSNDIYTVVSREGYKLAVKDDKNEILKRKFKPSELLVVKKSENPLSKSFLDDTKQEKKQAKIFNSLIRNEEMTPVEARAAMAQAPAPRKTRSMR